MSTVTDEANVLYEVDADGGHHFEQEQLINALNHIYGVLDGSYTDSLNDPSEDWTDDATLLKIDQSEFIEWTGEGSPGIRTRGWLFYPNTCATTQCKLLVWLHGGGMYGV